MSEGEGRHALALALLLAAGCASEAGNSTDAAIDHSAPVDTAVDDLGATRDAGMDSAVPRCVPGMSVACACVGGASGAQTCTAEGVYGACVCPDASAPTDAATDAWTVDIPVRPLGPRLITPQSISRTTTQRPTFRWVLPEGVTRARVTIARNRALTMDVRTGMATGTSWRPTEPLPFAVWFWRVEGLGDDGGVVWTSPTWEFRAPRRDTAVDSSWGTWRDFNGDGYDDLAVSGANSVYYGDRSGSLLAGISLRTYPSDPPEFHWQTSGRAKSDFNGDGLSDLLYSVVGQRFVVSDAGTQTQYITRLVVYLGRAEGMHPSSDMILQDFGSVGAPGYSSETAGDFNGDGFGDVLTTVECFATDTCASALPPGVYAYWGGASGLRNTPSLVMAFKDTTQLHGISCSSDLNLDGFRDISVSFGVWSPSGDPASSRRTFFSINPPQDLAVESPIESLGCLLDWDVDGDGRVEWVRGTPERVDILRWTDVGFAPSGWPTIVAPDIPSGIAGRVFGSRFAAGDINGDGYADLVVGAAEAPLTSSSVNSRGSGSAYLFLGSPRGLLPVTATWRGRPFEGVLERDEFGESMAAGGDIDGDGYDDVAIAAFGSHRIELRYGASDAVMIGSRTANIENVAQLASRFYLVE